MIKRKMNIKVKKSTEVMAKLSLGNAMNILRQTKVNRNLNIGKVLDIGTVINASEDLSALCSLPNARFKVLMSIFIKAIAKNSPYSYNPTEGKKYTGLLTFEQKVYQDIKATKDYVAGNYFFTSGIHLRRLQFRRSCADFNSCYNCQLCCFRMDL